MSTAAIGSSRQLIPSRWTPRLQLGAGICSIVFAIGTTLQNFVIVNLATWERMMVLSGYTETEAATAAPGGLAVFRLVGCLYILGNTLGILALRRRASTWLFWVLIAVNATQAAGVVMVPPQVFTASVEFFGPAGVLPSILTDGGALVLTLVLLGFFASHRTPWAQCRS